MDQIATRWCLSERPFRKLPKGILRKFLRGLSQFPLSSSANSRRVPTNDGMELDNAGFFDNTGHGNGGVDALKVQIIRLLWENRLETCKRLLIDRLLSRPVDCVLCHHD